MPVLSKVFTLDISLEQFLNNCSRNELIELQLLLDSERFKSVINQQNYENSENSQMLQLNFIPHSRLEDFEKENFNSGV